ncbi:hypothetical protein [Synechococcus sp. UW179A]|uniref:hypothetical protein n=1 Tax=Synechococcus sp. UW179A TaxID=2575510 RepID=UPI001A7E0593|nr:hypothetical protein [Synechococcus sp. UW179A]
MIDSEDVKSGDLGSSQACLNIAIKPTLLATALISLITAPGLAVDVRFSDSDDGKGRCWQGWCHVECNMNCNWIRINTMEGDIIQYSSTSLHPESREIRWAPIYEYEVDCKNKIHRSLNQEEWKKPVKTSGVESQLNFLCSESYKYDVINIQNN